MPHSGLQILHRRRAHRGPRMRATLLSRGTISGVAKTTSASMPFFSMTAFIRSSAPTTAAPALMAASASASVAKTATRSERPVPCGRLTVPRISWSLFRVSMKREIEQSTEVWNLLFLAAAPRLSPARTAAQIAEMGRGTGLFLYQCCCHQHHTSLE
jgi:hypothetical protein